MKVKDGKQTITSRIAYIAGFFDGEGCVRIKQASQRGNSFYVVAHLTNSNVTILQQVQDLFGGAIRMQERGPNKAIYTWSVSTAEAVDFLQTISPFVQDKKPQVALAIRFHNEKNTFTVEEKASWARTMSELKKYQPHHDNPDLLKQVA